MFFVPCRKAHKAWIQYSFLTLDRVHGNQKYKQIFSSTLESSRLNTADEHSTMSMNFNRYVKNREVHRLPCLGEVDRTLQNKRRLANEVKQAMVQVFIEPFPIITKKVELNESTSYWPLRTEWIEWKLMLHPYERVVISNLIVADKLFWFVWIYRKFILIKLTSGIF
jgi:hypothetical protein